MANTKRVAMLAIMISALFFLSFTTTKADEDYFFSDLAGNAAVLAELDSGDVLFGQNMNRRHPADALAKVMTLLVALRACEDGAADPYELVVMTESAWFDVTQTSTSQNIRPGEEMTLLDLMYCAYVGSANEACNLIAEHIAGSIEAFVVMMNAYADEIGCENTNFTNPHGQYDADQYTTAYNQYMIYREALEYPLFVDITGTLRHTAESSDRSSELSFTGTNSMLNSGSKYYYRHCVSGLASAVFSNGATGATYEGGYSIVALAESDGLSLVAVILGSDTVMYEDNSVDMRNLTEARRLFEWGFSNYSLRTILLHSDLVARAPVLHGAGADYVILHPETTITLLLRNDIPNDAFLQDLTIYCEDSEEPLVAPVEAGDVLGELTLTYVGDVVDELTRKYAGEVYGPIQLIAISSIELHKLQYVKMQIADVLSSTAARIIITILAIMIVAYAALVIRYNIIRRRRIQRNKETRQKIINDRQNQKQTPYDDTRKTKP